MRLQLLSLALALSQATHALKIGAALHVFEHTPLAYAAKHFYKGKTPANVTAGYVGLLANDTSFDLAANAETQGLKIYANNRNIRLIYIIVEVPYRLVANKASGIKELKDLKGKRVGTFPATSAQVFVHNLLSDAGLKDGDYTEVPGYYHCMKEPCAANTFPERFRRGEMDAFGLWEASVELGIRALGEENVVVFQNKSSYREVYSLYSTKEKLEDPVIREDILEYVRALRRAQQVYTYYPELVYEFAAKTMSMDEPIVEAVWNDHEWLSGGWEPELLGFLREEDAYLARKDNRTKIPERDLRRFLDESILEEL